MSSSSQSSEKFGNTKQISPSQYWCMTLNNYTENDYKKIIEHNYVLSSSFVLGKEVGKSGTPHLQAYFEFKDKIRPRCIHEEAHWEKRKGTREQNIKYCTKEGNYILKGLSLPKAERPLMTPKFEDLSQSEKEIVQLHITGSDHRNVNWWWTKKGKQGKSRVVTYLFDTYPEEVLIFDKGEYADLCFQITESDMRYVRTIIWDMPRGCKGHISTMMLEALSNMRVRALKYKGGFKRFAPMTLIVVSNCPPEKYDSNGDELLSEDRWHVKHWIDAPLAGALNEHETQGL